MMMDIWNYSTMKKCQSLDLFHFYKNTLFKLFSLCLFLLSLLVQKHLAVEAKQQQAPLRVYPGNLKVVYAVNAGGKEHTDTNGIRYDPDPLRNKIGTASDYGNNLLMIGRVTEHDEVLYRTERYHTATFGYDIPVDGDGDYALILKFCEVYFNEPNKKVFDVVLNKQHKIVSQLDIFQAVGHGTAHEEYAYFAIINGKLYYNDDVSEIRNGVIRLDFVKGVRDNPKINAFALLKGDVEHIPRLKPLSDGPEVEEDVVQFEEMPIPGFQQKQTHPPGYHQRQLQQMASKNVVKIEKDEIVRGGKKVPLKEDLFDDFDEEDDDEEDVIISPRKPSGPPHPNPYHVDDSVILLPLFIAMAAFIPMLYCLCKL